jgi:homoserine O-acetyltransferase
MTGSVGPTKTQRVVLFAQDDPLVLTSGETLGPVEVAFETYGALAPDRGNAVLVCHALTGDAHAAGLDVDTGRLGWWDNLVGPGKALDTDRFHVVCPNLLGGCQGTTGPSSTDPRTGRPYGPDFPLLSMADLVGVHRALLRHLGIPRLRAAVGGSLGGMQVLQWLVDAPEEVARGVLVGASSRLDAQNIAFSTVARQAILRDPDFAGGRYLEQGRRPDVGLAVARMLAHITYVSEQSLEAKFGRAPADPAGLRGGFDVDFAVESYLRHQGESFLTRFDALTYLHLTRLMDYFDPFADPVAASRFAAAGSRVQVLYFDSDWRFSTKHSRRIAEELARGGVDVGFRELHSPWGHDSFLLEPPGYHDAIRSFLAS